MAKIAEFLLIGNQKDRAGNPIPYHRATQGSFWDPAAKRYKAWKDFVREQYWLQVKKKINNNKPFGKDFRGTVMLIIKFKGENHADPDNIVKGILDALFENDKHVDVQTFHTCGNTTPNVFVEILQI